MKQAGNGIDGHHIGCAETVSETPSERAGSGPEIENATRRDANILKTLEQRMARALQDARDLGVAVAGTREQATHRARSKVGGIARRTDGRSAMA